MWQSLRAWVLLKYPYGEKGAVIHCLTDLYGRQSYFIPSVKSKSGSMRPSFLQPMTPLVITVNMRGKEGLERLKEVRLYHPFQTLHSHPTKQISLFFIAELLHGLFKEQTDQSDLWDFIFNKLKALDQEQADPHFALFMLVHLCTFAGYGLFDHASHLKLSQSIEARSLVLPMGEKTIGGEEALLLIGLIEAQAEDLKNIKSQSRTRRNLMDQLLVFLRSSNDSMPKLKSLEVLRECMI
jgi:DNA repair protein RecO (recombination protein O)